MSMEPLALGHLAPQIALVVGAAVTLVAALFLPRERQAWTAVTALTAIAAALVAVVVLLVRTEGTLTLRGLWALDVATGIASIVVLLVTAVVVVQAPAWFATDVRHGEVYVLLLLGATGATVVAAAVDLNELVVGVTLSSVTGYVLAAFHRDDDRSVEAGMKYFLIGGLANLALLVGVVLLFTAGGTTRLAELAVTLVDADPWLLLPAAVLVVVGLAFKAGSAPAHGWLPDVAEGAPAPAATFLTVVPKLGAFVALARIVEVVPPDVSGWRPAVAALAVITMTLGNLAALHQDDVRRLLGWSSVSQSGYALMAVAVLGLTDQAMPALLLFLASYAVGNTACFAVVTALRGRTRIDDWRGLASRRPWLATVMVLGLLSLLGLPPLAGFAGKLALFAATVDGGMVWLAAAAVLNTVLSLAYYLRVVAAMVLRDGAPAPVLLLSRAASVGALTTGAAVVAVGLGAAAVLGPASGAALLP
jgi:NADH-quinone oxidoreductase subunit N